MPELNRGGLRKRLRILNSSVGKCIQVAVSRGHPTSERAIHALGLRIRGPMPKTGKSCDFSEAWWKLVFFGALLGLGQRPMPTKRTPVSTSAPPFATPWLTYAATASLLVTMSSIVMTTPDDRRAVGAIPHVADSNRYSTVVMGNHSSQRPS